MKINIQATVTFYKVIVLSVGLYESEIMNERHFADYVSAAAYKAAVLSEFREKAPMSLYAKISASL